MCIYNSIYLYLGMTSLHYAVGQDGHTDIVKTLLDHGANVNTKDNAGKKDNNTYIIHIIHIIKLYSRFLFNMFSMLKYKIFIFYLSIY